MVIINGTVDQLKINMKAYFIYLFFIITFFYYFLNYYYFFFLFFYFFLLFFLLFFLSGTMYSQRRILLFTATDNPHADNPSLQVCKTYIPSVLV